LECFAWNREKEVAFNAIKQVIAKNAMASPDPKGQYHLAVDASKQGIGGVLFQRDGIEVGTEAGCREADCAAEIIIMFISFRLSDPGMRYTNSEGGALAVIRCLAELWWMVMASPHMIFVYTDHETLKTLLTRLDNNAQRHIAKWQERLGEYHIQLLHRSAKTQFMGIADGLSQLPTHFLSIHVAEDTEGLRPSLEEWFQLQD